MRMESPPKRWKNDWQGLLADAVFHLDDLEMSDYA
jgi:hypothetical protein